MGLDMYLYERTWCPRSYQLGKKIKKTNFTTNVYDLDGTTEKKKFNDVAYIYCRKGYWRKANAIHQFFLDKRKLDLSIDECNGEDIYITRADIEELQSICEQLLSLKGNKFKEKAKELLPVSQGFFWGSYEYDKWYRQDLKDTLKIIKGLNLDDPRVDVIYNANW